MGNLSPYGSDFSLPHFLVPWKDMLSYLTLELTPVVWHFLPSDPHHHPVGSLSVSSFLHRPNQVLITSLNLTCIIIIQELWHQAPGETSLMASLPISTKSWSLNILDFVHDLFNHNLLIPSLILLSQRNFPSHRLQILSVFKHLFTLVHTCFYLSCFPFVFPPAYWSWTYTY